MKHRFHILPRAWARRLVSRTTTAISLGIILLLAAIPCSPLALSSEARRDPRGDYTINHWSRYTRIELTSAKGRYAPGESIPIRFRIKNIGYQNLRIYPHAAPNKSFRFLVLDPEGREVPPRLHAKDYPSQQKRIVNLAGDPVKEIILAPGEAFERKIDLALYYKLLPGRSYRIKGYFWPDARFAEVFLRSENLLRLRVLKEGHRPVRRSNLYTRNPSEPILSPEETVYLFLSAEMRRNWKNYLKYLDLRRFITAYDRFAARYVQAAPADKQDVIRDFQEYLISEPSDRLQKFRILSSEPERSADGRIPQQGRFFVKVAALRSASGFSSRYEYTYTLEKKTDKGNLYWQIVYVEALLKSSGG